MVVVVSVFAGFFVLLFLGLVLFSDLRLWFGCYVASFVVLLCEILWILLWLAFVVFCGVFWFGLFVVGV